MKALVLSGGSIKGAFQAGALADLLTSNSFMPDAIYGTSVGSLNGAFIADRAATITDSNGDPNWVEIGNALHQFWIDNITAFNKIGEKRGKVSLFWSILRNDFVSLLKMDRLYELVVREIDPENLRNSPVDFYACSVDVQSGNAIYASAKTHDNILDHIIASTAIPFVMPLRKIGNTYHTDGGIREIAPLSQAIADKASEIICVVCQPENLTEEYFNTRSLIKLANRFMDIVGNETVNNDIKHCQQINDILKFYNIQPNGGANDPLQGKRQVKLQVIRPERPVEIALEEFNESDINKALVQGWEDSQQLRT